MKITRIECIPVSIPFAKPMVMSGGPAKAADAVVLKIHTDEGITGVSESGDTSLWYMGESQDSIMSNIVNIFGPQILLGENPFNIEIIVAKMDKAARANRQSKALVDYALHDLKGKALRTPVYNLLGGLSNEKIALAFVLVPRFGYTAAAALLSFYYVVTVGVMAWRGIRETRAREATNIPASGVPD